MSLKTGSSPSEHKSFEVFTTESKIYIKRGCWRSIQNIQAFMKHLWDIKLSKCSYSTLRYEFENFFGTNDDGTVIRYIGRPAETIRSSGSSMVRMNRQSGRVAPFEYMNTRKVTKKKGLMETLGHIILKPEELLVEQGNIRLTQKTEKWIVIIHHEIMPYYTRQVTLSEANSLQESEERFESSNVIMCVSPLSANHDGAREGLGRETNLPRDSLQAGVGCPLVVVKKEEEVIDSTHTPRSSESEQKDRTHAGEGDRA